jgi:hypothetical protein
MKYRFLFAAALVALAVTSKAQVLAPEKLLPNDTLALISIPDATKFRAALKASPQNQLWNDPAMKPFKDKFISKFKADLVAPLEKELGVKFSDYQNLAQGQFTFAVTQNGWQGKTNPSPGWILLLDTKEKSGVLKTNLANLKKKWVDSGKQTKTEKLREVEFTTLITSTDDMAAILQNVFPRPKTGPDEVKMPGKKLEILVGQSGSLLLVGNSTKVIEKVLSNQSGALTSSLSEVAAYEANHNSMFRDAPFYAWVNMKPLVEILTREAAASEAGPSDNPLMPKPDKIVSSIGLGGLRAVAFSYRDAAEGGTMQLSLGIPEANRQGIFKILAAEKMESGPPVFVPIDVTKFSRWRLSLPKAWNGLETMLTDISPAAGGVFKLIFDSAGKDKDPNYDLKKELLGNLGDDVINYRRAANPTAPDAAPSLYLLGSPNADKLASAVKIGMSLMSPAALEERDFLGRKIYKIPSSPALRDPKAAERTMNFSASGGYLALSTDVPMLEEYLRSSETKPKALSEMVGFKEAAEKVGGTGLGLFGFSNQAEEMRATLTALKNESMSLSDLLKTPTLGAKSAAEEKKLDDWADFSLLPPYETISKYFHYSVYGGSFDTGGFTMKFFYPTPPQLKK